MSSKVPHIVDTLTEKLQYLPKTARYVLFLPLFAIMMICMALKVAITPKSDVAKLSKTHQILKDLNIEFTLGWRAMKQTFGIITSEMCHRTAFKGSPAPNIELINFQSKKKTRLLEYSKYDRPLIVTFGSSS